ncbi:GSCFA domain-containing protein [Massilia scottii]|uniref:GSCFA domain-containing protein n=1 Tax=Massilia scottii TaxID=3057166 RepID=UPI002796A1B7|nr:GSCFA domain-containing protein [Massilia sp. CCM 9029]MDQ1830114.1 GSCFA domain-containing protein [Massilia sp. CCM 9029]
MSPVPLKHANGSFHPHIANSRSKAILLSAIYSQLDEHCRDPFVSYFPSYEFFAANPLQMMLWQEDDRHPSLDAINHVARAFASSYAVEEFAESPGFTIDMFS